MPKVASKQGHVHEMDMTIMGMDSTLNMEFLGILYIDPITIPEDEVWGWMTDKLHNEPQLTNMQLTYRDGWRPVDAEKYPQLQIVPVSAYYGPDRDYYQKHIIRGGLMLMTRPKTLQEQYEYMMQVKSRQQQQMSEVWQLDKQDVPGMQRYINSDQTTRGAKF